MEEKKPVATDSKCPRKLDFNAPLLSTRRPSGVTNVQLPCINAISTCDMVPFSWEKIPGKPKDLETSDNHDMVVPPPKLPPGRCNPPVEVVQVDGCDQNCDDDDDDDGNDGDVDDDDVYSDAIDIFSLGESMDDIDTTEELNVLGGLNLEIEDEFRDTQSPNFMIQRFLPDAVALAASNAAKNLNGKSHISSKGQVLKVVEQSYSSYKGCGFNIFFPWRIKHRLCGVKSPVREASVNVKSQSRTPK